MNIDKKLNIIDKEQMILRVICVLGGFITPITTYLWKKSLPHMVASELMCWIFTILFFLVFILSYTNKFVKIHVTQFTYSLFYLSSLSGLYFAYINHFTEEYTLLIILIFFSVILVFKKISDLLFYELSITLFFVIALYSTQEVMINRELTLLVLLVFSVVAYFILKSKIRIQNSFKESEERYKQLIDVIPDAVFIIRNDTIIYTNTTGLGLLGASNDQELIGKSIYDFMEIDYKERFTNFVAYGGKAIENRREQKLIRMNDQLVNVEVTSALIDYENIPAVLCIVRDITERKVIEEKVHQMAYYDALTQLPNRYYINENLDRILSHAKSHHHKVGIMFIDLDRFKIINDTLGHSYGDLLLQQAASRIKQCIRTEDILARYGADEFVIVMEDTQENDISACETKIIDKFSEPFTLSGYEGFTSPSIGISLYPIDGEISETLIRNADAAMYLAKDQGRNNFEFYTYKLNEVVSRKMKLENGLRVALKQNEIYLCYQPKLDLITSRIVGFEALARWEHPIMGTISPSEFIPLAEEIGNIIPIGNWILYTACKQNKEWHDAGLGPFVVSVNLSERQIKQQNFITELKDILSSTGLDSKYLELEITENVLLNVETAGYTLQQIKALGVKISLDDFGAGHSSFNYIRCFPIDTIKIDKSFIDSISYDDKCDAILKSIINLGHNLKLRLVAEGVEGKQQYAFMQEHKCDEIQGFYYCHPLRSSELEQKLRATT